MNFLPDRIKDNILMADYSDFDTSGEFAEPEWVMYPKEECKDCAAARDEIRRFPSVLVLPKDADSVILSPSKTQPYPGCIYYELKRPDGSGVFTPPEAMGL